MSKIKLPYSCPACTTSLDVTELSCPHCKTTVSGSFPLPPFSLLTPDEQEFLLNFIKSSGSLKVMAQQLKISYPSVRNILDDIIEKIKKSES